MAIFTYEGVELLVRWVHILAGIMWIGLLYYFNFVQGPFMNEVEANVKGVATQKLVPRALFWFRYGALVTFVAGVTWIIIHILGPHEAHVSWTTVLTRPTNQGMPLLTGMTLGFLMFLNVWAVIWPKQQKVIAGAPDAQTAARRALLASRTNVLLSIPMVFFMVASAHLAFGSSFSLGEKWTYVLIAGGVVLLVELNALAGSTGALKQPLEKMGRVVLSGVVLWAVLYGLLEALTG